MRVSRRSFLAALVAAPLVRAPLPPTYDMKALCGSVVFGPGELGNQDTCFFVTTYGVKAKYESLLTVVDHVGAPRRS